MSERAGRRGLSAVRGRLALVVAMVWVEFPGYGPGQRVLEDDVIEFVARVDGRHTYKSVLGSEVTLPAVTALWVTVE